MKVTLAATAAALTALGVMLARTSSEPQVSGQSRDGPVDAPPSGSLRAASGAPAAPLEGPAPSQPQGGAFLPRSEPASSDASNAAMPSAGLRCRRQTVKRRSSSWSCSPGRGTSNSGGSTPSSRRCGCKRTRKQWRRQAAAEQEDAQRAATLRALETLRYAERMLATGNSDGVDDELANAEAALSGRTRLDVEAAREALANEDLYPARQYLAAALAERRVPR